MNHQINPYLKQCNLLIRSGEFKLNRLNKNTNKIKQKDSIPSNSFLLNKQNLQFLQIDKQNIDSLKPMVVKQSSEYLQLQQKIKQMEDYFQIECSQLKQINKKLAKEITNINKSIYNDKMQLWEIRKQLKQLETQYQDQQQFYNHHIEEAQYFDNSDNQQQLYQHQQQLQQNNQQLQQQQQDLQPPILSNITK